MTQMHLLGSIPQTAQSSRPLKLLQFCYSWVTTCRMTAEFKI
jgi:hypothetical protein